ncbi:hypothetical protein GCM10011574_17880 [Microbispora bryophytorum]|uniref:Uncharacterized protein n=1 Tax=Microbispora bryophytorum TaxID=1460882 RepID=A0A8H9GW73_9ACTN|nr:hypothetical protein GCM10011574_17880 [Microbispora bryophytorum]
MPKLIHQQTVDCFHEQPMAAVELLREVGGIEPPEFAMATAEAVDATRLAPVEYRADAVVVLDGRGGEAPWGAPPACPCFMKISPPARGCVGSHLPESAGARLTRRPVGTQH